MKNNFYYIITALILLVSNSVQSQVVSATCPGAEPVCSQNGTSFQLSTGSTAIANGSNISNPSNSPVPSLSGTTPSCFLSNGTNPNWFLIYIGQSGFLQFTVGQSGSSGFYDWMLWQVNSNTPNSTCPGITTNNTQPPVACNWNSSSSGFTGMMNGTTPPGGNAANFTQSISVTAGQAYMLCFSNYSSSSGNAQLSFPTGPGAASVTCTPSTPDQTICLGNSATVNITASGQPITSVNWLVTNGVSNTSGITNVIVTPTVTTDYIVAITQGGTTINDTFRITVVNPPAPNAGPNQTVCFGTPISLTGTVGSASNTVSWQAVVPTGLTPAATANFSPNFNSLTPTVTVNQPGVYKFILRETSTLCGFIRDTVVVTVIQQQIAETHVNPSCGGYSDGSITITSANATEYSFNNGTTWVTSNTQSGFASGTYQVCARNAIGCQKCMSVTLVNPIPVVISVSNDTTVCQNGTANLSASATGGTSYSYHWANTTSTSNLNPVNPVVTGYYSVYAENQVGCLSLSDSILVTVLPGLSATMSATPSTCPGYPASLTVTPTGGIGSPYTMVWNTSQTDLGTSSTLIDSPNVTTTYTVTITDACESTPFVISDQIKTYVLPIPMIAVDQAIKCEPAVFDLTNTTQTGTSVGTIWNLSDGQQFINSDNNSTVPMYPGVYDVQLIVVSPDGCIDSTWFYGALTVQQKPIADFRWSPDPVTMFNTNVLFTEYCQFADYYSWNFGIGLPGSSTQPNQNVLYPDGETGFYDITLVATSYLGCSDTITKTMQVFPEVLIYAPNSFTPDGDEFNQTWYVTMEGIDVYDFELLIFDRWGEIVWESHDLKQGWDGTYHGKILPQGQYRWIIRTKDILNDKKYEYQGGVNIIR